MPRSSTFLPKVTNNNDNGNRSHNNSGRSVNSTWSVALASIPSDQSHYSIHDIDGSDYFTHYSENNQSNKNSEDDNQSGSQSVDSEHSDENDHAMVHNLSMNSNGGGHYVQVHRIPSNAPARRPRSRSRSTNGSGSGSNNNSERSGLDNSTKSKENALDVVANALSVAAAAVGGDDNDNEQSHHHRLHYERIDSRNHSEIESDNVQLSGEHEPQKFSGSIKRQSRMNYTAKKRNSLRDSVTKIMTVQRIASLSSVVGDDDDDDGGGCGDEEQENSDLEPKEQVLELWREVVDDLDGVVFKKIYNALDQAKNYILSTQGQSFVNEHLCVISSMLLDQSPIELGRTKDKFEMTESDYVDKSIRFVLQLVNEDLRMNAHKFSVQCQTIDALPPIFDYKNTYYQDSDEPGDVRFDKLLVFQRIKGFYHLAIYFEIRANTPLFPDYILVHRSLVASCEGIIYLRLHKDSIGVTNEYLAKCRKESKSLAVAVMKHMNGMKCDNLAKVQVKKISTIVSDLKELHLEYALVDDKAMIEYFGFVKQMVLKLLSVRSVPHRQVGQDLLYFLIHTIHGLKPIPSAYTVADAGLGFLVCGTYTISSCSRDDAGFVIPGANPKYEHVDDDTGKKCVLLLSTIENDEWIWSLSEEHDEDPIPTEYTDYYTNICSGMDHIVPSEGWISVEDLDDPPPIIQPSSQGMVQLRDKHKDLKHDLASWFLENNVTNSVFDTKEKATTDPSSVSKLVEAIDAHIESNNTLPTKMSNLLVTILPPLCNSSSKPQQSIIPCSKAAVETAKQRLASAERWHQNTARLLLSAQTEHNSSTKELEEARAAVKELEWLAALDTESVAETTASESITSSITHESSPIHMPSRGARATITGAARSALSGAVGRRRRSLVDNSLRSKGSGSV